MRWSRHEEGVPLGFRQGSPDAPRADYAGWRHPLHGVGPPPPLEHEPVEEGGERASDRLLRDHPLPPFVRAPDWLFGRAPAVSKPLNSCVRFFFATTVEPPEADPLDYVGIRDRLLSFGGPAVRRVDLAAYARGRPAWSPHRRCP